MVQEGEFLGDTIAEITSTYGITAVNQHYFYLKCYHFAKLKFLVEFSWYIFSLRRVVQRNNVGFFILQIQIKDRNITSQF